MAKACTLDSCRHAQSDRCKLFRLPRKADSRDRWLSSIRRYKKGFSKEARICSCHFADGNKHHGPTIFSDEKCNKKVEDFPNMKIIGNEETDKGVSRNLPENTTCVPVTESIPKVSPINSNEIFYELTQVMELQKLGHLMEQEMVNRFKILQELGAANDELAIATSQTKKAKCAYSEGKNGEQVSGQSGQNTSSDRPNSKTGKAESSEEQQQETEAKERDALLVLRPELIVPELRDLPTLHDMLTMPTTLTEATRLIFALRKDMLVLRNGVLKRALAKSEEQIEMRRKRRVDKRERLLEELSKVFSKAQLAFLRDGGKSVPWTLEDYLQSISLRLMCRHRTFTHIRNTMKIPLPSMYAVRSMANCGLMPEVTKRYKELAEAKDLRLNRHVSAKKRARPADAGAECSGIAERPSLVTNKPTKQVVRGGARGVSKRRRTGNDEEPEPPQPSSRRPRWDASALEMGAERNSSDDESESDWSDQVPRRFRVTHPTQDHVRGRGRVDTEVGIRVGKRLRRQDQRLSALGKNEGRERSQS